MRIIRRTLQVAGTFLNKSYSPNRWEREASFKNTSPPLSSSDILSVRSDVLDTPLAMYKHGAANDLLSHGLAGANVQSAQFKMKPSSDRHLQGGFVHHGSDDFKHCLERTPLHVRITTYLSYFILIVTGHLRDFFGFRINPQAYAHLRKKNVRRVAFL
ncbi:hypothetical protein HDU84_004888 [Entophlyctis sp. JEL0112]|nr:hypothetical protein HDU84_004888 [Entophlyctis sp. JEL0112]